MIGIRQPALVARNWLLLHWAHVVGQPTLALHGLQRSGTNYLLQRLMRAGFPVENAIVLRRNSVRHKHFRWQDDKTTIPGILRPQYGNEIRARSLDEVHAIAGYAATCRHIVIRKHELAWLKSILNWGLRCNWYLNREDALAHGAEMLRDYKAYYEFWTIVGRVHPTRVLFVDYDSVTAVADQLQMALRTIGVRVDRQWPAHESVGEVPMSPADRAEPISENDIKQSFGPFTAA